MFLQSILEIASIIIIVYAMALLQSHFFAFFSGRNLEYECHFSTDEAFEGEQIYIIETVTNRKKLPVLWLKAELDTSKWLDFAESESVVTHNTRFVTSNFILKGGQRITRKWPVYCTKRGSYSIENVALVWSDILGMKSNSLHINVNANLIVYPSIMDLQKIGLSRKTLMGDITANRWINEDPFITSGVRSYSEFDPLNRIHWLSTAKTGKLMSRKNEFTSDKKLFIILNMQSTPDDIEEVLDKEIAEFNIKIAASLIDEAFSKSIPVQLAVNGVIDRNDNLRGIVSNDGMDRQHSKSLLYYLAQLELKVFERFLTFLESLNIQNDSHALLITPYINDSLLASAMSLSSKGINTSVIIGGYCDSKYLNAGIDIYCIDPSQKI